MSRRVKREGKYSGLRADGRPFPEILVGIDEIAAYLRKSPRAISRWINEGMLPAPKDAKGRRWTTKGVIDQLVLQIYKAEMQHKPRGDKIKVKGVGGGSESVKVTGGPAGDQAQAKAKRVETTCSYCDVSWGELHKPGCPVFKARPLTTPQQRIEQASKGQPVYAEPLEIELDEVARGKLIISEPDEPGSGILKEVGRIDKETLRRLLTGKPGREPEPRDTLGFGEGISFKPKGQAMLQVEGTLTEKDKQELREWWKDQPRVEDEGEIEHQERPV